MIGINLYKSHSFGEASTNQLQLIIVNLGHLSYRICEGLGTGTINDAIARMENVALSHAIRAEGAQKAFICCDCERDQAHVRQSNYCVPGSPYETL